MASLLTAIGSFSADCAITTLKKNGCYVVGCDIYPEYWHYEASLCDIFYQAPYATSEDTYISFLLDVIRHEHITHLVPLTDLEIDVINRYRNLFNDIVLCIQSPDLLTVARDKYVLSRRFSNYQQNIGTPITVLSVDYYSHPMEMPVIAKPRNGRSSEGLKRIFEESEIDNILNDSNYIVQEEINGDIFCVDVCRDKYDNCVAIPRKELIRTKNGAGMTVCIQDNQPLISAAINIAKDLGVIGCINMEYISDGLRYYLIDINPRFSAGVAFSKKAGYDMIINAIRAFNGGIIDAQPQLNECYLQKKMVEVINGTI